MIHLGFKNRCFKDNLNVLKIVATITNGNLTITENSNSPDIYLPRCALPTHLRILFTQTITPSLFKH